MRNYRHGRRTARSWVASITLVSVALALSTQVTLAAPPAAFTLSPSAVTFATTASSFDYQFVTLETGPRWLIYQNPASTTGDPVFFDTQAGSCWQNYESLGNRIPGKTTCTIQVGFHPLAAGTFTGQLVVYKCTAWHTDPTFGMILCDATDGSETVDLRGTAT